MSNWGDDRHSSLILNSTDSWRRTRLSSHFVWTTMLMLFLAAVYCLLKILIVLAWWVDIHMKELLICIFCVLYTLISVESCLVDWLIGSIYHIEVFFLVHFEHFSYFLFWFTQILESNLSSLKGDKSIWC